MFKAEVRGDGGGSMSGSSCDITRDLPKVPVGGISSPKVVRQECVRAQEDSSEESDDRGWDRSRSDD